MNHLAAETSPYLLQHADNPVNWHPWGDAALDLAARENRPILLSIGYSACHWCHVMAHESFENAEIAGVMNRLFVNIKVDREERPDLDKIYQAAHHLMMQRPGGWPLTVFLDPENHRPFFAGTYFPDQPRHGMPGFAEVLERVAEYYREHPADIRESGDALVEALGRLDMSVAADRDALDAEPLTEARRAIAGQVDREHGGVGGAPKFPHTTSFERLLRHWRSTANDPEPDVEALYLAALTLTRMAEGGIYDHLGGGFCRYTVDATWTIPHFEKMLYDNGPLLALYAQLWIVSADDLYRRVTNETADWVLREMTSPDGGFYSTLDADSEGEEGRFYVWTPDEVHAIVSEDEYAALAPHFGLDREANFEGHWHLRVYQDIATVAATLGRQESEVRRLIDQGRARLKAVRDQRVWPGRDEKILTAWNGLMIRGLAIAGRALRRDDLGAASARAIDFIRQRMVTDGRLMAVFKDGRARFNGYLDDYAFLLDGVIESLQSNWNTEHLHFARWLADQLIERFQDDDGGGFFFTSHDHEQLIHRSRPMSDDSTPSGNGIAAQALGRLGHLLGDRRYIDGCAATLQAGWAEMERFPHGHTALLAALEETLDAPTIIIIRGMPEELRQWSETVNAVYAPNRMTFAIPADAEDLPESLAVKSAGHSTTAYVCRGTACTAPLESLQALAREIAES